MNKCDGNHGGPKCSDPECWNGGEPNVERYARLMNDMAKYYFFLREARCINIDEEGDEHGLLQMYLDAADSTMQEIRKITTTKG